MRRSTFKYFVNQSRISSPAFIYKTLSLKKASPKKGSKRNVRPSRLMVRIIWVTSFTEIQFLYFTNRYQWLLLHVTSTLIHQPFRTPWNPCRFKKLSVFHILSRQSISRTFTHRGEWRSCEVQISLFNGQWDPQR